MVTSRGVKARADGRERRKEEVENRQVQVHLFTFGQAGYVRESARICRDDRRSLVHRVHEMILLGNYRMGGACETLNKCRLQAVE